MKKTILTALVAFGLGLGLTLIAATPSMAVHKGAGGLSCGGCHTMHSSQGNAPMDGITTGNFRLIRGAGTTATSTTDLCLTCHSQNGTNAGTTFNTGVWATTPPKVHLTSAWGGGGFDTVGAGGDFANVGTFSGGTWLLGVGDSGANVSLGKGHSLQATSVTPPGGAAVFATFSCVLCHNAHGTDVGSTATNRYRNLASFGTLNPWFGSPTTPLAQSYVGAVAGSATQGTAPGAALNLWPVYRSSGTQNYYLTDTTTTELTGVKVGMAYFCGLCHNSFHEPLAGAFNNNVSATNSNDWVRHPAQGRLNDGTTTSGSGITIVDMSTYNNEPTANKLPVAQNCGGPGSPACGAVDQKFYYDATTTNSRVFCLSCHFAHAGPYNDALRWDYTASVTSGGQIGNVIPSNVGCQLCHNR